MNDAELELFMRIVSAPGWQNDYDDAAEAAEAAIAMLETFEIVRGGKSQ